ncbi:MAG: glycosyltransferase family 2 protein [Candidatus Omnitrophota bacterium]|nr:MAG: glycosyltransferase family 2 protein [Candidatus Omnitrophota bacterium]
MKGKIAYSVIIPFYNEDSSVEELLGMVTKILDNLNEPYEILAVNDGSTDDTLRKLEKMRGVNSAVIPINFSSRKGQTSCLLEGFRRASGHTIISMDGDFQDDPAEIPSMLEAFRRSRADTVCGWRRNRKNPISILMISKLGNFFQRIFFNVPVHDISCTFRIYKSAAIKSIDLKREGLHRFLPFFLKRAGFSLAEKQICHKPRKYGCSKYSFRKAGQTIKIFFGLLFKKY